MIVMSDPVPAQLRDSKTHTIPGKENLRLLLDCSAANLLSWKGRSFMSIK
jgi:hypothetical protein